MPTKQEFNLFRRLVGDYGHNAITDQVIQTYLDDATYEVTTDFVTESTQAPALDSNQFSSFTTVTPAPLTRFDELFVQFHPEVIYKAAINWWWNRASELSGRLSQTVGQATQNVTDLYTNAMQMIANLEVRYEKIQQLGLDIEMGNISIFNKRHLQRQGGQREESALIKEEGGQPGDLWYG